MLGSDRSAPDVEMSTSDIIPVRFLEQMRRDDVTVDFYERKLEDRSPLIDFYNFPRSSRASWTLSTIRHQATKGMSS